MVESKSLDFEEVCHGNERCLKVIERSRGFLHFVTICFKSVQWILERVKEVGGWNKSAWYNKNRKEGRLVVLIQHKENDRARRVVYPEGVKGYGWENIVTALSDLLREMAGQGGVGCGCGCGCGCGSRKEAGGGNVPWNVDDDGCFPALLEHGENRGWSLRLGLKL